MLRIGIPHCPKCGKEVQRQSIDQIVDKVMSLGEGTKIQILAPVIRGKKGEHKKVFENARKSGYVRVKADGEQYDLSEPIELKKTQKHNIEIIIDRLIIRENIVQRLTDSLETAIALTGDVVLVEVIGGEIMSFSQNFACDDCGISLQELTPRLFSFNNPYGACDNCDGLGALSKIDPRPCYSRRKFKYNKRCYFSDRLGNCKQKRFDGLYVFYSPCRLLRI